MEQSEGRMDTVASILIYDWQKIQEISLKNEHFIHNF